MSSAQKVIKILAIIFAIFIILNICSAIIFGISVFTGIMYSNKHDIVTGETIVEKIENLNENIKLKIDLEATNLEIREGTEFKIEKNNTRSDLKYSVEGNTLEIKEKSFNWLPSNVGITSTVILYVPKDIIFKGVEIASGVGRTEIYGIKTEKFDIDAGVGNIVLDNVVSQKTDIDGGAGNFTINNSILSNLDFDCGVGVTKISGEIKGKSNISCGVGSTELNLLQNKDSYSIQTQTGLGTITLNGERCSNGAKYGSGEDLIKIEGGVGSVKITTK